MEITVQAWAKLNLSLDVLDKLPNGYHALCSVMETVELCDTLELSVSKGKGVSLETNLPFLPVDESNIAAKAAEVFFRELGLPERHIAIRLTKRIPVSAGLAGGSTNAAAVLRGLNTLMETKLSREDLMRIGLLLGSDVPYCVTGGTALAEGRGEQLTPLPALPLCHIVICKPKFSIRTADLFARIDCAKIRRRPDTAGILQALECGAYDQVARRMYNVFEDVLDKRSGEVTAIKHTLLDNGALGTAMSGTGPSVFALFDDATTAETAYAQLKANYPETFLTKNREAILT